MQILSRPKLSQATIRRMQRNQYRILLEGAIHRHANRASLCVPHQVIKKMICQGSQFCGVVMTKECQMIDSSPKRCYSSIGLT